LANLLVTSWPHSYISMGRIVTQLQ